MDDSILEIKIKKLQKELQEAQIITHFAKQAHKTLQNGIKTALGLQEFPDFYKLYGGNGSYAESVVRLLIEEVEKLKSNQAG